MLTIPPGVQKPECSKCLQKYTVGDKFCASCGGPVVYPKHGTFAIAHLMCTFNCIVLFGLALLYFIASLEQHISYRFQTYVRTGVTVLCIASCNYFVYLACPTHVIRLYVRGVSCACVVGAIFSATEVLEMQPRSSCYRPLLP